MLRPTKFKPFETAIAYIFAALLFLVGITALVLAFLRTQFLLGLSGLGIIGIATIYLVAANRRRPL
jgi:hypothetical protein